MRELISWLQKIIAGMDVWVTIFTFATISMTILKNWFVAENKLRPAYWLMISLGASLAYLNTYIALNTNGNEALLLTNILGVWSILMGIRGLRRLNREK